MKEEVKALCVTSLDNELFVHLKRDKYQIAVYNIDNFELLRHSEVPGLKASDHNDMTSCVRHRCVYVSDSDNKCIHAWYRSAKTIHEWPLPNSPMGVSVTPSCNLLVTLLPRKLLELSGDGGKHVRLITLQSEIEYPTHSAQLTTGEFVVSHGFEDDDLHQVCLVDSDGKVKRSYGGQKGSKKGQLDLPFSLAVDKDSQLIVADHRNNRVVLLKPTMEFVRYVCEERSRPHHLYLHQATQRLFVSQSFTIGKVTVIQL